MYFPLGLPYLFQFLFKKLAVRLLKLSYGFGESKKDFFKNCGQIYHYFPHDKI